MRVEMVPVQSGATINKGDAILMTPTGAVSGTQALVNSTPGKAGVALMASTATVPGVPAGYIRAIFGGFVGVNKTAVIIYYGEPVGFSSTAGQVQVTTEATLYEYLIGYAMEGAISTDTSIGIQLAE
jgi:1-acyl-sn-glycerol-3-phosphate acyltransferase